MLAMAVSIPLPATLSLAGMGNTRGTDHLSQPASCVDMDLTSLAWLQKPGVLNSVCTALTGSPQRVGWTGTRALRKPKASEKANSEALRRHGGKQPDKMMNVILNVRNRKYNGEDAQKPPLSFACMIFMAVESSPHKMLPVKDIYEWIMWKFPFYRTAHPGWKNSVRHNLSLNKCFRKVDRSSLSSKGKSSPITKGGLWMVDNEYRRSLLAALRRSPYHPYHSYFTPPLSPSDSTLGALWCDEIERVGGTLDQAEKEAAISMCMISGNADSFPPVTPGILHAIQHDHSYAQRPSQSTKGLSLAEVAAAAAKILQEDWEAEEHHEGLESDEGFGGEEEEEDDNDSEEEEEDEAMVVENPGDQSLADSGFGCPANASPRALSCESRCGSMEELGVNALLCLAGGAGGVSSTSTNTPAALSSDSPEFFEDTLQTLEVSAC